jgi:hypothetical protein
MSIYDEVVKSSPFYVRIGTLANIYDLDKSKYKYGDIVYCTDIDKSYVFNGTEFICLYGEPEKDKVCEPRKIRVRNNCCNCGAPLPNGDRVRCSYCDTVQETTKYASQDEEVDSLFHSLV